MKVVFWPYLAKAEMLERFAKHANIEIAMVDNAEALDRKSTRLNSSHT